MTIDLSTFERGRKYKGRYRHDLKALQIRLKHIQVAYIVHGASAVLMFEGWDAAGKGGIIQRLTARWDPRNYEVWPIAAPSDEEKKHGFLWRFRRRLPHAGNISVFDRSWYGRVLVERVEGFATPAEWERSYGEINAFEAKLVENGTTLIKLFIHTSAHEQDKRLRARLTNPWKRWKTGLDDYRNRDKRPQYLAAMHEMFARTDTGIAPWRVIDGNDKKAARIATLRYIVACLEAGVSMEPPMLDPAVEKVAEADLG